MRVLCCSIVVLVEATGENRGGGSGSGRRAKIARLEMSSRDGPASARELKMGTSTYVSAGGRSLYTLFIGCEFNAFNTWVTHKWVRLTDLCAFRYGLPCDGWANKSTTTTTFGRGSLLKLRVACPTCSCIRSSQCSTALFFLMVSNTVLLSGTHGTTRCDTPRSSRDLAHRH
jgi:hypothetical protein